MVWHGGATAWGHRLAAALGVVRRLRPAKADAGRLAAWGRAGSRAGRRANLREAAAVKGLVSGRGAAKRMGAKGARASNGDAACAREMGAGRATQRERGGGGERGGAANGGVG